VLILFITEISFLPSQLIELLYEITLIGSLLTILMKVDTVVWLGTMDSEGYGAACFVLLCLQMPGRNGENHRSVPGYGGSCWILNRARQLFYFCSNPLGEKPMKKLSILVFWILRKYFILFCQYRD
jgi:hypothetical protein